jgi:3'-phosphoadenosine 5'-phosphosulfate synthase
MVDVNQKYELRTGCTFWFTGLSGSGKSTISIAVKDRLDRMLNDSNKAFILDGDIIRMGLNKDLGFSAEDRTENIRRISEVSKLFAMSGQVCMTAFISPYGKDRDFAREVHGKDKIAFYEVHVSTSLDVCEQRDPKGLYKKARAGVIKNFTGISDPYEAPANPAFTLDTGALSLDQCVDVVIKRLIDDRHLVMAGDFSDFKSIDMDKERLEYLQTIADGWAYPLTGFMNEIQLVESMHMNTVTDANGNKHLFSVPITLPITNEQYEALKGEAKITLKCSSVLGDEVVAILEEPTFFANRKEEICARTFGTLSAKHVKAERIMAEGDWLVSAKRTIHTQRIHFNDGMDHFRLTPQQIKEKAIQLGADAIYAFQVRNPLHNGHCLLLKDTREQLIKRGYKNPVLLLHPLGGWVKDDDVPTDTRMLQHQALLDDGTLPPAHTILALWPSPMYYGGPTEVLWHASSRIQAGITHFITGRDPAGVKHPEDPTKDCYDVWHGQKLLVHVKDMLKGVEVMPFKVAAYNKKTQAMEFFSPAAANKDDFEFISGSRMRAMAKANEEPPAGFMSPAGWKVLAEYYRSLEA